MRGLNLFRASLAFAALLLVLPGGAGAAAAWLPAKNLDSASLGVSSTHVAMDAAGNAFAVWARFDSGDNSVWVSRRPFGSNWSPQRLISVPGQNSLYSTIVATPSGRALAAWAVVDGPTIALKSRARSTAGVWAPIQTVATLTFEPQDVDLAIDPSGRATAVWFRQIGSNIVVEASTRPANGAWSVPQNLSVLTEDSQHPRVAMDSAGNAIAVWAHTSSPVLVQSAYRPAGGAWGPPQPVSVAGGNLVMSPQVVLGPAGKALAIWGRFNGSHRIIQSATRSAGVSGAWGMSQDVSATGQNANEEQLARDAAGNVIAVWHRSNGTNTIVQAASRPVASGVWQVPANLSAPGNDATFGQIAMSPGGRAVAVWQRVTTAYAVQAAIRTAGGAWGAAKTVSAAGSSSVNADAAMDPNGIAAAVWYRFSPDYRPQAAIFQGTLCTVPRLVGKPLAKAKSALKKAHCRTGTVRRAYSAKPAGRVVSQGKKAGTKLLANTKVKLVVSRGARP